MLAKASKLQVRRTDAVTVHRTLLRSIPDMWIINSSSPSQHSKRIGKLLCFPGPPLRRALRRQKQNKGSEPAKRY